MLRITLQESIDLFLYIKFSSFKVLSNESPPLSFGYKNPKLDSKEEQIPLGGESFQLRSICLDNLHTNNGKNNLPFRGRIFFPLQVFSNEDSKEPKGEKTEELKIKTILLKVNCVCNRIRIWVMISSAWTLLIFVDPKL